VKAAGLAEIKKELQELSKTELLDLCLALAKYKKDNKEYLGYLLFEAHDKSAFANEIRRIIDHEMGELRKQPNLYFVKKGLRRVLRIVNRYCKYISDKALEADLHIYFCTRLKESGIPFHKEKRIVNLYAAELKKINTLVGSLHEDVRADYRGSIERLEEAQPQGLLKRIRKAF
jgi:hypothetical protein